MANYVQHISKLAPALYLPLDDVAASGNARQLGALTGVTATYNTAVLRTHGPIDGPGAGLGGAMAYSVAAPAATESAWGAQTTTFQSGTTATGWAVSWWGKIVYSRMGSGVVGVNPTSYTLPDATFWFFHPYGDGLSYFYGPSGALMRTQAALYAGSYGKWVHWAFSWSSTTQTLYRNGNVVWTQAVALTTAGSATAKLRVYSDTNCAVAHVAYWNRPLVAGEARFMHRLRGT